MSNWRAGPSLEQVDAVLLAMLVDASLDMPYARCGAVGGVHHFRADSPELSSQVVSSSITMHLPLPTLDHVC